MINTAISATSEWITILEKLVETTGKLLDSAKRKQAVLASDKLEDLQELLQEEEVMTAALEKVEQQRLDFSVNTRPGRIRLANGSRVCPNKSRGRQRNWPVNWPERLKPCPAKTGLTARLFSTY